MAAAGKQYAFGATVPGTKLELIPFEPPPMGPKDVVVDVLYCGMCHSDVHKCAEDWGPSNFPLVPGHEVVGKVVAVGADVTTVSVGQTVGFGPQRGSCESCEFCAEGIENVCSRFEGLYDPGRGGYASSITVSERFTFPIPEGIPLELAGPLLCAGVTTFAPLARNVKPGNRVGILGIGGLGHLALQYAAAMGAAEVLAISTSPSKEAEARRFGATSFLLSSDAEAMKAYAGKLDFILCCASGHIDFAPYMRLLKPRRNLCLVGLPAADTPLKFLPFDVVMGEKGIIGSMIGGTAAMKEMLEFSAKHRVFPQVEVIDFGAAQEGIDRILANTPRYRMVLKIEGFRERQRAAEEGAAAGGGAAAAPAS